MDRGSAPEPVDIGKGLKDTIGILSSRIQQKNIQVDLTVSPDLPAITGFGGELNQVWNNLLDNAIDASPENGTVSIKVARKGEDIVVFVTDNGPGIPADISDRIFEPFFTTKPIGQGSGLGLDVAQRIVNLHRGVMSASSKPGYTEFVVKLPTTG
ncbi:MAG: HAMP domain-containing histidine kinase [Gemmatimonadota bacterium]|nr:HAMP domain-containing histidine kinase [Gemmatimonadota bacterium]MDH5804337.1 HAMP domain-containing histidine kinase [Gemmatimonadota bacterium]